MMFNEIHILHILVVFMLLCMETLSIGSESQFGVANMTIAGKCIEREGQALLILKQGLVDRYGRLSSWESKEYKSDCCQWEGVGCDNRTGHVTHLYLSSLNPCYSYKITYTATNISHSLLDLHSLNYLDLGNNYFGLQPIPQFIGSLKNLVHLDLSFAYFAGAIPNNLGNLSKLHHLDLDYNPNLEAENIDWLFHLSKLTYLDMSFINLSTIDWVSLIQRIPSLSILWLEHCNLVSTSAPSFSLTNSSAASISSLDLSGNHLKSSIFDLVFNLSGSLVNLWLRDNHINGRIPESFGHMTALTHLDLSSNSLEGVMPSNSCSPFVRLDLGQNKFTSSIFYWISNMSSSLVILGLNDNLLKGQIPNSLALMTSIADLDLSFNQLEGVIPNFICNLSNLYSINFISNMFSGSLPDFTGCSSLHTLQLGENQITDWKTRSISQLSNLNMLDLSRNLLHSTISDEHLSNLTNLDYMFTSFNSLTFHLSSEWLPPFQLSYLSLASCKLGPKFPIWIRNQTRITSLDFSDTQISDTVPMWFWNISTTISTLDLSSNSITGKFSSNLFDIREIDLSSNYFEGAIPPIPSRCSKINLSKNNFSGTLSLVGARNLYYLDLSHNLLFGRLPDSWVDFQALAFLNLGYNNFSGRIPMSMGHLVSLQTLILRNNKFSGDLPTYLRKCSNLGFLDLGSNNLSEKIPAWIGEDLTQLYALILRSNDFYGDIPYPLCNLSDLHFLDLSENRISGTVPSCLGNLTAMIQNGIELTDHYYNPTPYELPPSWSYYVDNALARWKGQVFEYGRNFAYLTMIDFSANELTGEIPVGITRLLGLRGLNLSMNKFYGKVPLDIGQMKLLEFIDLSRNKFSGYIPQSMTKLSFLGYLDLSNNNFSGKIPSGTQLRGFGVSAYEGNVGLCGPPLTKICPADEVQPSSDRNEVDKEEIEYKRWLYISAALGFGSTFWGLCGTLVLNRRWRRAYFLFLVNLKDRLFLMMALCINRLQR